MNALPDQLSLDLAQPIVRRRPCLSFWHPMTGELDRKYLRVCAVYRLLRRKKIGRAQATRLLAQRHSPTEMKALNGTMDLWRQWPIKDMLP
jgi:hypothetical protein